MKRFLELCKEYLWLNCCTVASLVGAAIATLIVAPFGIAIFALMVAACAAVGTVAVVLIVAAIVYYSFTATNNFLFKRFYSS